MPWPRFVWASGASIILKLLLFSLMSPHGLVHDLCQWDCRWYVAVSQLGYDRAEHYVGDRLQANWAFFPLYPLIMRALTRLGPSPEAAGVAVSSLALWGFLLAGWRYRRRTRASACGWTWLLLVTVWPYGFLFNAPYTEALYAFITSVALLCLAAGAPWLTAAASALLTATRPTGILFAAWFGIGQLWSGVRSGRWANALLPALLAPLGLLTFMVFLWVRTGDPLAFVHVQAGWDHAARNPLGVLLDAVRAVGKGRVGLLYDAGWAFLGLLASVRLALDRRFLEAWLCGSTVLVALFSGVLWSMPRFVACNPVCLFAATDLLDKIRNWPVRGAILITLAGIELLLVYYWYYGAAFLT